MSGLFFLLVASFLYDEPLPAPKSASVSGSVATESAARGEPLPAPRATAASPKTTKLISSTAQLPGTVAAPPTMPLAGGTAVPAAPIEEPQVGWGIDSKDNSMYLVIQMPPSSIETFASGQRGQELTSTIPPMLRNRIQKVIVRFGTGPVERFPSEAELASTPILKDPPPQIANLDQRTPVNVDNPRSVEVVPTASMTQVPVNQNVLPSTSPRSNVPGGEMFPTSSPLAGTPQSNAWNTNVPARPASGATDGFAPASNRVLPQSLSPFGSTRSSGGMLAGTETQGNMPMAGATQGNVTYSGNQPNLQGYQNPNTGTYGSPHLMASNPNNGIYPPVNDPVMPNSPGASIMPPGANNTTHPNYGMPVSANTPTYANGNGYPQHLGNANSTLPPPLLQNPASHQRTATGNASGSSNPWVLGQRGDERTEGRDVLNSTRPGSWVPFFLVLSFILNVYFGLWLNHLSTKYRHLLGNVRGLSEADLTRA